MERRESLELKWVRRENLVSLVSPVTLEIRVPMERRVIEVGMVLMEKTEQMGKTEPKDHRESRVTRVHGAQADTRANRVGLESMEALVTVELLG